MEIFSKPIVFISKLDFGGTASSARNFTMLGDNSSRNSYIFIPTFWLTSKNFFNNNKLGNALSYAFSSFSRSFGFFKAYQLSFIFTSFIAGWGDLSYFNKPLWSCWPSETSSFISFDNFFIFGFVESVAAYCKILY